jgi:hypothetical protein
MMTLGMHTSRPPRTGAHRRHPIPEALAALPRIGCEGCARPIASGTMPQLPPGQVLVILCWHRDCKHPNVFPREGQAP